MDRINIEYFLKKIYLPIKYYHDDFVLSEKLKTEYLRFVDLFEQCDGEELQDKKSLFLLVKRKILETAKKVYDALINTIDLYETSNMKEAQESFDRMMRLVENDLFVTNICDYSQFTSKGEKIATNIRMTKGYEFYRVREGDSYNPMNKMDLFHLPITKRQYSSNERFNLAGFPALYLASMLPLAWQECRYPKHYYYSRYKAIKDYDGIQNRELSIKEFRYVAIYSPLEIYNWGVALKYNNFELWINVLERYLKTFPLILACSFINYSGKGHYKQEYIVPQMLMQWVRRNYKKYFGITYFSCLDTGLITGGWCGYNVAIPVIPPYDKNGYSILIKKNFKWNKPEFVDIFSWKKECIVEIKTIEEYLQEVSSLLRNLIVSNTISDYLLKTIHVAEAIENLIVHSEHNNVQSFLYMLSLIEANIRFINSINILAAIKKEKGKKQSCDANEQLSLLQAEEIVLKYQSLVRESGAVEKLLQKIRWTAWKIL